MKTTLVLLFLAAMSLAPLATASYSDGFETGSAPGWTLTGLWNVNSCVAASGTYALNYNVPPPQCNYDEGYTTGVATSPTFKVTGPSSFDFESYIATEFPEDWPACDYDTAAVEISVDGGPFTTVLTDLQCGTQDAWTVQSIDLTPYAGSNVQVQFEFNSRDGSFNDHAGWAIDNVALTGAALPTPELGTLLLTGAGVAGLAGIVVIQRRK